MLDKFDAKEQIERFRDVRRKYQKSRAVDKTYYSERYDFLFSIEFKNEICTQNESNCHCFYIYNSEEFKELLNELQVYSKQDSNFLLNRFSKVILPVCVQMLTRTLSNSPDSSQIKY